MERRYIEINTKNSEELRIIERIIVRAAHKLQNNNVKREYYSERRAYDLHYLQLKVVYSWNNIASYKRWIRKEIIPQLNRLHYRYDWDFDDWTCHDDLFTVWGTIQLAE